jgi:hypothetical protein
MRPSEAASNMSYASSRSDALNKYARSKNFMYHVNILAAVSDLGDLKVISTMT